MSKGPPGNKSVPRAIATLRLELFVRDPDRSLTFYEQALGFVLDLRREPPSDDYIPIRHGAVRLALSSLGQLPPSHYFTPRGEARVGVGVEIVLEVERLQDYEQRAQGADAIVEPTQLRPWGLLDFRVVDPDGYYIRVTERYR